MVLNPSNCFPKLFQKLLTSALQHTRALPEKSDCIVSPFYIYIYSQFFKSCVILLYSKSLYLSTAMMKFKLSNKLFLSIVVMVYKSLDNRCHQMIKQMSYVLGQVLCMEQFLCIGTSPMYWDKSYVLAQFLCTGNNSYVLEQFQYHPNPRYHMYFHNLFENTGTGDSSDVIPM